MTIDKSHIYPVRGFIKLRENVWGRASEVSRTAPYWLTHSNSVTIPNHQLCLWVVKLVVAGIQHADKIPDIQMLTLLLVGLAKHRSFISTNRFD